MTAGPYLFCASPECDTVYFSADGASVFTKSDLTVRVGLKEKESPRTICYCFGHTYEEIEAQVGSTGRSTVPDDIRLKLRTQGCDCVHTNPSGSCCLGEVMSFVNSVQTRQGAGSPGVSEHPGPGRSGGPEGPGCCCEHCDVEK